jgi:hypothetical protein
MSAISATLDYEFESLVVELLEALGFNQVFGDGVANDHGIDIQAMLPTKSATGEVTNKLWLVQLKHYRSQGRISMDNLAQLTGMLHVKSGSKALLVTSANLTSAAREYVFKFNETSGGKLEIWDRDILASLLTRFPNLQSKYNNIISDFPKSTSAPHIQTDIDLITRLTNCPLGQSGWKEFEDICTAILVDLFVPPLKYPKAQARTLNGLERRDLLFSLRNIEGGWEKIQKEFDAKFLLCEFKNYTDPFTKDEVNQTRIYLRDTIGKIGIIFSRKGPDSNASKMRNSIYSQERKVILFFDDRHLKELINLKRAGQNPLDLIQDAIDDFYISHE